MHYSQQGCPINAWLSPNAPSLGLYPPLSVWGVVELTPVVPVLLWLDQAPP